MWTSRCEMVEGPRWTPYPSRWNRPQRARTFHRCGLRMCSCIWRFAARYLSVAMSRRLSPAIDLHQAADERYRRIIEVPGTCWGCGHNLSLYFPCCLDCSGAAGCGISPAIAIAMWVVCGTVSIIACGSYSQLTRVLAGVGLHDDWTVFWQWAKSIYAMQSCRLRCSVVCIALGWRQIANTWPWRLYFATAVTVVADRPHDEQFAV